MTNDEQTRVVERCAAAEIEGRIAMELVGKIAAIVGARPVFAADGLSQEELLTAVRKLASPPAPSGWQQRIAAMDPYLVTQYDDQRCFFCGEYSEDDHKPDCLWQNAKDGIPPSSSPAMVRAATLREAEKMADEHAGWATDPVRKSCLEWFATKLAKRAKEAEAEISPVSEGSPAKPCGMCGGTGIARPITQAEKDEADRACEAINRMLADTSPTKETR